MKGQGFVHYKNYGLDLLFKSLSISKTYFNQVGLKVINSTLKQIDVNEYTCRPLNIELDQKLFLLTDFLFDEYTLLNTEIKDSPHYQLMHLLLKNDVIRNSDYIQRVKRGTIDMRPAYNFTDAFYRSLFETRMTEINDNQIKPILLTKINDLYYILDGKHRASLLKLLNKTCPCICIDNFDVKDYYALYWKQIKQRQTQKFKKHLAFYSQL